MTIRIPKTLMVIGCLTLSTSVAAQIEEIIVTAQKREQNLQDVPSSISALNTEAIKKLGLEDFRQWADYVPGITMSVGLNSRRGGPLAAIRGVTNQVNGQLSDNTANATASYTIGQVPVLSVSPAMADLARIEVLKGPQGTLFGTAAMGGVIRYIPNLANTEAFSGNVGVGAGFIDEGSYVYDVNGMLNIPLIDNVLAIRASGYYKKNDGFISHIFPALSQTGDLEVLPFDSRDFHAEFEKNANKTLAYGSTVSLTYTPSERFTLVAYSMRQVDNSDDQWQVDLNSSEDLVVSRFIKRPMDVDFTLHSVEATYDIGIGDLAYVGGYYERDLRELTDGTRFMADTLMGLSGALPFFPTPVEFPFASETKQWTHELRLQDENKALGSAITFDYVFGIFYQEEKSFGGWGVFAPEWNANLPPNSPAGALILTENGVRLGEIGGGVYKNEAVFGNLTFHFGEKLSLGVGARSFDQTKDRSSRIFGDHAPTGALAADDLSNLDFRPDGTPRHNTSTLTNDGVTPSAFLEYRVNEDVMVYFRAAEGKRMSTSLPDTRPVSEITAPWTAECEQTIIENNLLPLIQNGTQSDSVWTYDLGTKSVWLDDRLIVNASTYASDWTDLQQTVFVISLNPNCTQVISGNVGAVQVKGAEIESTYLVTDNFRINGSIAYTDAKVKEAPVGLRDSIGQPLEEGDAISSVPPLTASLGVEYGFQVPLLNGLDAYIRVDWRYVDERILGFGDKPSLREAIPLNVASGYQLTDVRLGFDDREGWSGQIYVSNVFNEIAQFESRPNFFYPTFKETAINQPRTLGFQLSRSF